MQPTVERQPDQHVADISVNAVGVRRRLAVLWGEPYYIVQVAVVIAVIVLWQVIAKAGNISEIVLPPPSDVLHQLWASAQGSLWSNMWFTVQRMLIGLAIGMVAGVLLGMLIGLSKLFRAIANPLVTLSFPIPKIALIPLFITWFGLGSVSEVLIITTSVVYISLYNTAAAVVEVPSVLVMAFRNLGASRTALVTKVILPHSLPGVVASLRISYSSSLVMAVAVEMLVGDKGLGYMVQHDGQLLLTSGIFATLIVLGILGLVGFWLIDWAERSVRREKTHKVAAL